MSTKKTRTQNIAELNQLVRDNGNLNVLLVHAIAERVGLSATEFECCQLIQDAGPMTAGELAKSSHITSGGMTGMIDRLERAGFVKRSVDPKDRRRVLVTAVEDGPTVEAAVKKVESLYKPLQDHFYEVLAGYTDEQIAFLVDFFAKANAMFHDTAHRIPQSN
jgi:DNA-binding MarR family transcriptional regulator